MGFKCLTFLSVAVILCVSNCWAQNQNQTQTNVTELTTTTTTMNDQNVDDGDGFNQTEIMLACNETFHTEMNFLVELNSTGSFPDETDKTPMCFVRCYLEKVGIISKDAILNRERAIQLEWSTSDETLDDCDKETRGQTNTCEKAYYLTRCVTMRNIVDNRKDNE